MVEKPITEVDTPSSSFTVIGRAPKGVRMAHKAVGWRWVFCSLPGLSIYGMSMKKFFIILSLIFILPIVSHAEDVLGVTGITAVRTLATANDSFADGWKWIFNIHIPANESSSTTLKLKFGDWSNGSQTVSAAGNIRLYSSEAINASTSDTAVVISAADTYSDVLSLAPAEQHYSLNPFG